MNGHARQRCARVSSDGTWATAAVWRARQLSTAAMIRLGKTYGSLMVDVRLPPHHDLAAKKEKVIGKMHAELPALINEAFGAIEKQVKKTAALRRAHDAVP